MQRRLFFTVSVIACVLASAPIGADDSAKAITPSSDRCEGLPPLSDPTPWYGPWESLKKERDAAKQEALKRTPEEKAARRERQKALREQSRDQKPPPRFGVDYDRAGRGTRTMNGVPGMGPSGAQPKAPPAEVK